ncbi:glycoside hydrolase family 28 protein [Paenibacillus sp. UMB7766-LJ446]|uniref:glycoside hydrolase family 28 protein n=1 Tax=Paenibacillus sp. UMB7766-LJ446 TaxID=3046313 RepID=UPI00254F377F|nr:glycoside hydrolase family 28 protein [Paenibacillus sp. UMB7766-LJ446]MDK8192874.1 glycoside hydrolase family 28 protein [Paenibacillus sp. UMB7766-LJ446]
MNTYYSPLGTGEGIGSDMKAYEVSLPVIPAGDFQITDYGAVGDGLTDNTEVFRLAIAACSEAGGGRIVIPAGVWLTGPIVLRSRIELHVQAGALVTFSRNFDQYPLITSSFEGWQAVRCQSPIDGEHLEDIAITGEGIWDGGGEAWRPVKRSKMTASQWSRLVSSGGVVEHADGDEAIWWPSSSALEGGVIANRLHLEQVNDVAAYEEVRDFLRPNMVSLRQCKRVLLDGPTFQNSPAWNLHPWASEHVTIRNVSVRNPWFSQNGDGLDIESCRHVIVEQSVFDVGDDAICLKSGKDAEGRELGLPSEYITIRDCTVYHGHGGFVIGSEMSGGVRHVRVSDCTFIGTDIGLRFKSARGRGGVVEDIQVERIYMKDIIMEAISFSFFYANQEGSARGSDLSQEVSEETPVFRDIRISDVVCAGAETALLVSGLPEMPLDGLIIQGYTVAARNGVQCAHAKHLRIAEMTAQITEGPLIHLHQCKGAELEAIEGVGADGRLLMVTGHESAGIVCRESDADTEGRQISVGPEVRSGVLIRR